MSWIEKLHQTYEKNAGSIGQGEIPLLPVCHTTQKADITIVLDIDGNFLRAMVVSRDDSRTIIPATEESAGRTYGAVAHPLCDKLQYLAADYEKYGGDSEARFSLYLAQIEQWSAADPSNLKLKAVCVYIRKGNVVQDLVGSGVLHCEKGMRRLLHKWNAEAKAPEIFNRLAGGDDNKGKSKPWQANAFVRFAVERQGDPQSNLWNDRQMWDSWIRYNSSQKRLQGLCFVSGKNTFLADQHPSKIRNDGDKAKLISSNDTSGFTFRGRFSESSQACGVGFEVTQKGHNALRWLIARQGRRDGDQAIVAWAVSGAAVPDPMCDTLAMLFQGQVEADRQGTEYTAQEIGRALKKLLGGYSAKIGPTDEVVVMGLDSATPGRMSISFYRELTGSDFLDRVLSWHDPERGCVWRQYFAKDLIFVGAPSPWDISEIAHWPRADDKLRKATVARLLPCILDGQAIPKDLVDSCVRRAGNQNGLKPVEWEKALGIACALYKHAHKQRKYTMALERDRKTRDYLYGRLLAAADELEGLALYVAGENRQTNAARLMQRFADRPCSTWKIIELSLAPYKARLGGRAVKYMNEVREVMGLFNADDFIKDVPLSGEFLIGYHSQRAAFRPSVENNASEDSDAGENTSKHNKEQT